MCWCKQLVKTPCPSALSTYWPFVGGIHRLPVDSHHKGPSYAELWCFRWCSLKQTGEQTVELPVIWDVLTLMWLCCNRWFWFYPKCNIHHGSVNMFYPLHPIARPRGRHIECPIFRSMFYLCGDQYMMTSSNGIISALLAICAGNSPVNGEISAQRPVARSFDVFFDLRLNERLSKQSWGWWFETPSRPLWRHSNELPLCTYHHFMKVKAQNSRASWIRLEWLNS